MNEEINKLTRLEATPLEPVPILREGGGRIIIIKYNAGNIQSVLYALERIGVSAVVTDDHAQIKAADKVIFPGVGEASSAMRYLNQHGLSDVIKNLTQPVLGICLGMQLMCRYSEENDTDCLGIFDEEVKKFNVDKEIYNDELLAVPTGMAAAVRPPSLRGEGTRVRLKIPQIGWNNIYNLQSTLFNKVPDESYCYFVHGYYAALGEHTIGTTDYVQPYSSALHKDNFYGVQFHPEKSANVGEQILKNFIELV